MSKRRIMNHLNNEAAVINKLTVKDFGKFNQFARIPSTGPIQTLFLSHKDKAGIFTTDDPKIIASFVDMMKARGVKL